MGDRVQKTLETLLPTLLELKAKNLFSEKEIKSIVRKRRNFEYALVGKGFSKEDVLSYIEYEIALEALRKQRAEKKGLKLGAIRSTCALSHILRLFGRAVRIWPQDKLLWNQYVDFCFRSGSTKRVLSVLLEALAHHPRELSYWLLAADRELQLGHLQAPRRLMQLALRQLPDSLRLWEEFFKFEVRSAIRQAKILASRKSTEKLGLEHLLVVIKGALSRLTSSDCSCFIGFALDYVSLIWSPSLAPYFRNGDQIESYLVECLEKQSASQPLMSLLCWKLRLLPCLNGNSKADCAATTDTILASLTTDFKDFGENEWCVVILMLCYLVTATSRNASSIKENEQLEAIAFNDNLQPDALFSLKVDPEQSENLDNPTAVPNAAKAVPFDMLLSPQPEHQFLMWVEGIASFIYRCLGLPTDRSLTLSRLLQTFDSYAPITRNKPDAFVCRRLEGELRLLSSALLKSESSTPLLTTLTPQQEHTAKVRVAEYLISQTFSRDPNEWAKTVPFLVWAVCDICDTTSQTALLSSIQAQLEDLSAFRITGLDRFRLNLLNAELSLYLNGPLLHSPPLGTSSCVAQPLHDASSTPSVLPFSILSRVVTVGAVWLEGVSQHQTEAPSSSGAKPLSEKDSINVWVHFWADTLYSTCPLRELPALVALLVTRWFNCPGLKTESVSYLEQEWQRVMQHSFSLGLILPVRREIVKRVLSVAAVVNRLTALRHALCNTSLDGDSFWDIFFSHLTVISRFFHTIIQSTVRFDNSLVATTEGQSRLSENGTSPWILGSIPAALSTDAFVLRYITVAALLDTVRTLSECSTAAETSASKIPELAKRESARDRAFRELTPLLRSNPVLNVISSMRIAKHHMHALSLENVSESLDQEIAGLQAILS